MWTAKPKPRAKIPTDVGSDNHASATTSVHATGAGTYEACLELLCVGLPAITCCTTVTFDAGAPLPLAELSAPASLAPLLVAKAASGRDAVRGRVLRGVISPVLLPTTPGKR